MALVKFDRKSFVESLEPGISVLVVSAFEKKLEEKMNGIIEEVFAEMKQELPKEIKTRIHRVFEMTSDSENINVEVDLSGGGE